MITGFNSNFLIQQKNRRTARHLIGIRHQITNQTAKLVSNATIDATETTPINHNRHNSTMEIRRTTNLATTNPATIIIYRNIIAIIAMMIDLRDELTIILVAMIGAMDVTDNDDHLKTAANVNLTDNRDRKRLVLRQLTNVKAVAHTIGVHTNKTLKI